MVIGNYDLDMKFIALIFTLSLVPTSTPAQTKKAVIERYLNAIGGIEKLKGINSKIDEGLFVSAKKKNVRTLKGDTLRFIFKHMRPDRIIINFLEPNYSNSSIMCYNGKFFWTKFGEGDVSIQPAQDGEYFRQTSIIGLWEVLMEKNPEIEYLGTGKLEGKEFYTLRVKRPGWFLSSKYFFDKVTGLVFCAMTLESSITRYTIFKNYREIDGLLFHHLEEVYDNNWQLESQTIFNNIKLNIAISDNEFNVPDSK